MVRLHAARAQRHKKAARDASVPNRSLVPLVAGCARESDLTGMSSHSEGRVGSSPQPCRGPGATPQAWRRWGSGLSRTLAFGVGRSATCSSRSQTASTRTVSGDGLVEVDLCVSASLRLCVEIEVETGTELVPAVGTPFRGFLPGFLASLLPQTGVTPAREGRSPA